MTTGIPKEPRTLRFRCSYPTGKTLVFFDIYPSIFLTFPLSSKAVSSLGFLPIEYIKMDIKRIILVFCVLTLASCDTYEAELGQKNIERISYNSNEAASLEKNKSEFSNNSSTSDTNKFISVTAGFEAAKPAEWHFITADENIENLKRVDINDDDFKELMLKYSTAPLVAIMKYKEPFDDLNPSFKVNIKPLGQLKGADPKKIIGLFLPQFKKIFQDFNLVQPPMDTTISGLKAGYMRINYSLTIPDGRAFPTSSELWIVPRGDYFFMIGAGTRQDEKTGSRDEIKKILSSIVM